MIIFYFASTYSISSPIIDLFFFSYRKMNVYTIWHAFTFFHVFTILCSCATATSNQEVLIKKHGKVIFYDNTWTHSFHLNLKSYVENAMILENSTNSLINLCNVLPTENNCQFFVDNLREETQSV